MNGEAWVNEVSAAFCDGCGRPVGGEEHPACVGRRALEPPRYCPQCARRMVVQVTPSGWSAWCSAHGVVHESAGRDPELV